MIDCVTIDDAIMREVKKASTQIECSQSEIDDENNNGLQMVIDDATASNASMVCLKSSISIESKNQEKIDEDGGAKAVDENCELFVNFFLDFDFIKSFL